MQQSPIVRVSRLLTQRALLTTRSARGTGLRVVAGFAACGGVEDPYGDGVNGVWHKIVVCVHEDWAVRMASCLLAARVFTNFHVGTVGQLIRRYVVWASRLGLHYIKDSMKHRILVASLLLSLGAASVFAQTTTTSSVQRDVNQQTRIESGLQDGSLSTKEAGRLEKEESQVDRLQARDLKDGKLSLRERAQLRRAQNRASQDIHNARTNDVKGNPESASSERMQADVQRNVNQEKRIEQGVQSGTLTNREAGTLERAQARVDHKEAVAARDGRVGKLEQARIQHKENQQSEEIFDKKQNAKNHKG